MAADHEIHAKCGYENARCACPKGVTAPLAPLADRKALAEAVRAAITSQSDREQLAAHRIQNPNNA